MLTEEVVLLYEDECHIRNEPYVHATWHERGKQKQVRISATPKRLSLFGAVNAMNGEFFCQGAQICNAQSFQHFLIHLLEQYKQKYLIIVVDNARYHHAQVLHPFLHENRDRLILLFLPSYSPNLNLVERIWKWLKRVVLANRSYSTLADLKSSLVEFLDWIASVPEEVMRKISKPHLLTS
jgi:transposase